MYHMQGQEKKVNLHVTATSAFVVLSLSVHSPPTHFQAPPTISRCATENGTIVVLRPGCRSLQVHGPGRYPGPLRPCHALLRHGIREQLSSQ